MGVRFVGAGDQVDLLRQKVVGDDANPSGGGQALIEADGAGGAGDEAGGGRLILAHVVDVSGAQGMT